MNEKFFKEMEKKMDKISETLKAEKNNNKCG